MAGIVVFHRPLDPPVVTRVWCKLFFVCVDRENNNINTVLQIGINYQPVVTVPRLGLTNVPRSVCRISNSTLAGQDWDTVALKFDKMFRKRAFIFWYIGEGMEESEMEEAREDVAALQKDYKEISEVIPQKRLEEVPLLR